MEIYDRELSEIGFSDLDSVTDFTILSDWQCGPDYLV